MGVHDFLAGQFHKIRLLKQSARGEVWLAEDSAGHFVVWKETTVTGLPYRILKENPYRLWPAVLYCCETEKGSVIIEEYINGDNIGDLLQLGKKFTENEVMSILWQLVDGLIVLHKLGIIHRDIKPGNLIWQNGNVYLIDFETARQPNKESECDTRLLGTRGYAAPEQFGFAQTDARSDIYSLGVTVKELAGNDIPADLAELLRRCTAIDPAQRFRSAEEIKAYWQGRKRNRYLKTVAVIFFCLLAAMAGWLSNKQPQKNAETQPAPLTEKQEQPDKKDTLKPDEEPSDPGKATDGEKVAEPLVKPQKEEKRRIEQTIYLNGEIYDKPHIVFTSDEYRKWPRLQHNKAMGKYSMVLPGEWNVRMHVVNLTGETVNNLRLEIEYDTALPDPESFGERRKEYIEGKSLAPGEEMDFEWSFTGKIIMHGQDGSYRIVLRMLYDGEYDVWDCAARRYGGKNSDIKLTQMAVGGYSIFDEITPDPRKEQVNTAHKQK